MSVTDQDVLAALRGVMYPGYSRDVVSFGVIHDVRVDAGRVSFEIVVGASGGVGGGPAAAGVAARIRQQAEAVVRALPGVREVQIRGAGASDALRMVSPRPATAAGGAFDPGLIPEVVHTVAVASGKGGVGKSTVAVNLAVALARLGLRVGLLDADIYGPSIPLMFGRKEARPTLTEDRRLLPFERFGVRFMSLGFMVDPESAVIWRGPMVMKAIDQLLRDVVWGALDVLLVDMPPGTGDAQLTLSQRVQLAGAVIVTTPQDVALADAIKGVAMFRKVDVPILGLVENMSYFVCPKCSERSEIFGYGGGRREAERLGVPFLGEIPLDPAIRAAGDGGTPIVAEEAEQPTGTGSPQVAAFMEIAGLVRDRLAGGAPAGDAPGAGGLFDRFRKAWGGSTDRG